MSEAAVKTRAAEADALTQRLDALTLPQAGFTAAARADALARLRAMGLPHPRDEYWRFTDPRPFNAPLPQPSPLEETSPDSPLFTDRDRLVLVFVDGRFDAAASSDLALDGAEIDILSQAETRADHWAGALYGRLEAAGQTPVPRPFAALNTAVAADE